VYGDGTFIFVAYGTQGLLSHSHSSGVITYEDVDDQGGTYLRTYCDGNFIYCATTEGLKTYSVDGSGNLTLEDEETTAGISDVTGDGTFIYGVNSTSVLIYSVDGAGDITLLETDSTYGGDRIAVDPVNGIGFINNSGVRTFKVTIEYTDITNSDITGDDLTTGSSALTMPASAKEIDAYITTA
jgi:hypothetical protein